MTIDGHCHCGQITFEAEVDPNAMLICHCTDCQTLTGSVYRAVVSAPATHFVLRTGAPTSYVKTAESGNKRRHAFCGNCGTRQRQIGRRSALSWVDALTAVPATEKGFGGH